MNEFHVFLNKKEIDIVFYEKGITVEEVKKSLIEHDLYDINIKVIKYIKKNNRKDKFR